MKKLFLLSTLVTLLPITSVYASVSEGSASSHVTVENNVEGSGTTTTHIESTVNGSTQVFDSNKSGTYTLDNNGSSVTPPTATTAHLSATPSRVTKQTKGVRISFLQKVKNFFITWLDKITKTL